MRTRLLPGFTGTPPPDAGGGDPPPAHRPVWVQVDLAAITANAALLAGVAAPAALMAVVKADGYGHGIVPAAQAALRGGATWLGVAMVEEGAALRRAGIDAPVLVLAEPPPAAAAALLEVALTPTVYSPAFVAALETAAADRGAAVGVHLKVDTGMRRVGVPEADWPEAFARLAASRWLHVDGLWSHLAVADERDNPFTHRQAAAFEQAVTGARDHGLRPAVTHLCNSAGTLLHAELHRDLVRCGIALYGCAPAPGVGHPDLQPALAWRARLSLVKRLAAGEAVSYGLRWTAPAPTTVGTVPAGYADGVPRALTNRGQVVHAGRRVPIVGTVCMDQLLVDLGPAGGAPGDPVWLLGGDHGATVSAEDWAAWLDTITYEVVARIGPRVPRVHQEA